MGFWDWDFNENINFEFKIYFLVVPKFDFENSKFRCKKFGKL